MGKRILIAGGGETDASFLRFYAGAVRPDFVIAADRGLDHLLRAGMRPDLLLGDYDSSATAGAFHRELPDVEMQVFPPEKDYTDMELALREALRRGADAIDIFGGTGGRLDHFVSNLYNLMIPLGAGVPAFLLDTKNCIFAASEDFRILAGTDDAVPVVESGSFRVSLPGAAGKYLSFLPLTDEVGGFAVSGVRYPVAERTIRKDGSSLTVSNEITESSARVSIGSGIMAVFLTDDQGWI